MHSLSQFEGRWTLSRVIQHDDGTQMTAQGHAHFTPDAGGLAYFETGHMQIGAMAPLTFERRYRFEADLSVYFEDGRFFHQIPKGGGKAHHHCPPDDYHVHYTLLENGNWQADWRVVGPKKSYSMSTTYKREGQDR